MANVWEQLICQTCGSNAVEIVDGLLCCKACKSKHTLQEKISEEEVIALNRAASYRNRLAFDDAFDEYTELLKKYPDNEAANWGAFLSFYGIVYEKDTDGKYIPTCHRLSEKPVESSAYYYHFGAAHKAQAEEIEKLRVAIMDKAKKIQPYDVFICYKATEERFGASMPTKEAAWARDVYDMLTHELKLRVFFAEKSLQGSNIEYEPHIYSALNSAKLMFVLTTGIENVNATWVKNEWKRFSHYIKEGQDKTIRVVYDGIQPYDLPQELQKTQAIDHNAMGWDKAVRQAAENIFAVKEEKPEWQKAMEEMQAKMNANAENGKIVIADKYCVKCGGGNVKAAKFCADCGGNVFAPQKRQYCVQCGKEMLLLKKFCPNCGQNTFVYTKEDYQREIERRRRAQIAEEERIRKERELEAELARQESRRKERERSEKEERIKQEEAKRRREKVISIVVPIIIIIIILGNIAGCLYARNQRGWCDYEVSADGSYYIVKNGNNFASQITILEEYEGKPVKAIGGNAFENCYFLKSIKIPDSITSIGSSAFYGCDELTSVVIGNGVTSIGTGAFRYCSSLTSIEIGDSVTSIGDSAFDFCSSLTNITIPDSVTSIGAGAFDSCGSLTSIIIPKSVTSIGRYAFRHCGSLKNATIPDSVTSISDDMFYCCKSLANIEIPGSVTSVGKSAFSGCEGLTNVVIGNGVKDIGEYSFQNCKGLKSIIIPINVNFIGKSAFQGCDNLEEIELPFVGETKDGKNNTHLAYIFGGITSSYNNYVPASLKKVTVNGGKIAGYAFLECYNIKDIILLDGISSIDGQAFRYCTGLTSFIIPDKITKINGWCFYNCKKLKSVTIPNTVTSIIEYAFLDCTSLTNIIFNGTMAQWRAIKKGIYWNDGVPATEVVCTDGTVKI